ncbi:MAG: cyclic pyranopterin monophosphate synthase MoaC [Desulfobacterales bacterium]
MGSFTHLDEQGRVRMVDVTQKEAAARTAVARGKITMKPETFSMISAGRIKKGNVLETARIAGIMAAKKTAGLIPMCHPIALTHASVDFFPDEKSHSVTIEANVGIVAQTGVEMEALTAVSIAALTIYDMCKSLDREMVISDIVLLKKSGGKSGTFLRSEPR